MLLTSQVCMESGIVVTKQPLVEKESKTEASGENLPIGLKHLSRARHVTITQLIDPVEVLLCCFARPCRYSVYMEKDNEHSLYIQEVSDCYARQIMGAARSFALKVTDTDGFDDIRLVRPQTCSRGYCGICCLLPSLEVQSPPGQTVAVIRERRTCCCPVYEIVDTEDNILYEMHPPCIFLGMVNLLITDIEIKIIDRNGDLAARLCKQTKHKPSECTGAANDFIIKYLTDLPVLQKIAIFGAVFLVDFHYFERQNRCCC